MAGLTFQGKVALVRTLHWLACRFPRSDAAAAAPGGTAGLPCSPDLLVAPSNIPGAGLGLFARRQFAAGEVVCVYTGVRLSTLEALRTPDWRYLVGLGRNRQGRRVWIDGRPTPSVLGRYANHQDDPARRNVRTQPRPDEEEWVLTASRPIAEGEELYLDYGRLHQHCFDRGLLPPGRRAGAPTT